MTRDLTTGSPMRLIWSFALPTLFGMLFQQFYNMMDTVIVGQLLGASALASVGSTSSINFFVIGFCMGVCNGFAIPVAQRMGAGDYSQMRRCVANAGLVVRPVCRGADGGHRPALPHHPHGDADPGGHL